MDAVVFQQMGVGLDRAGGVDLDHLDVVARASVICASVQRPIRPKPLMPIVTVMKCAFPETLFVPSMAFAYKSMPKCGSEKVSLFRMLAKTFGVCANIAQGSFTEPGKSAARGRNRFRAARVASGRAGGMVWRSHAQEVS
jgi:hypothetical protein